MLSLEFVGLNFLVCFWISRVLFCGLICGLCFSGLLVCVICTHGQVGFGDCCGFGGIRGFSGCDTLVDLVFCGWLC